MKATGVVNRRPWDIFRVISNDKYRKEYDSNYDQGHIMERIGDQTFFGTQ
jgi:hypothetical protein